MGNVILPRPCLDLHQIEIKLRIRGRQGIGRDKKFVHSKAPFQGASLMFGSIKLLLLMRISRIKKKKKGKDEDKEKSFEFDERKHYWKCTLLEVRRTCSSVSVQHRSITNPFEMLI